MSNAVTMLDNLMKSRNLSGETLMVSSSRQNRNLLKRLNNNDVNFNCAHGCTICAGQCQCCNSAGGNCNCSVC